MAQIKDTKVISIKGSSVDGRQTQRVSRNSNQSQSSTGNDESSRSSTSKQGKRVQETVREPGRTERITSGSTRKQTEPPSTQETTANSRSSNEKIEDEGFTISFTVQLTGGVYGRK